MAADEWDPMHNVMQMRNRFRELFGTPFRANLTEESEAQKAWTPPLDVYERQDGLVVQAELPGLSRDAIEIEFKNNRLIIQGNRPVVPNSNAIFHRLERQHGPFRRVLAVALAIDVDGIDATYENGVLTIVLPIMGRPGDKKIEIHKAG